MYTFNNFSTYGVGSTVETLQSRIIGPFEEVPYSDIVMQAYPPVAIMQEPFVGVKVLVRDMQAHKGTPAARLHYLDQYMPALLHGQGVIVRETNGNVMADGFWVITMPVPKSQLKQQLNNLGNVLSALEQQHGIVYQDIVDINVSGRCPLIDTERSMAQITIPKLYQQYLVQADNSPYTLGGIVRINDEYLILKSRWKLPRLDMFENISMIVTCVQGMFRCK